MRYKTQLEWAQIALVTMRPCSCVRGSRFAWMICVFFVCSTSPLLLVARVTWGRPVPSGTCATPLFQEEKNTRSSRRKESIVTVVDSVSRRIQQKSK